MTRGATRPGARNSGQARPPRSPRRPRQQGLRRRSHQHPPRRPRPRGPPHQPRAATPATVRRGAAPAGKTCGAQLAPAAPAAPARAGRAARPASRAGQARRGACPAGRALGGRVGDSRRSRCGREVGDFEAREWAAGDCGHHGGVVGAQWALGDRGGRSRRAAVDQAVDRGVAGAALEAHDHRGRERGAFVAARGEGLGDRRSRPGGDRRSWLGLGFAVAGVRHVNATLSRADRPTGRAGWATRRASIFGMTDPDAPALLVVDVQQGFDDAAYWGPRNNPACEEQHRRPDRARARARTGPSSTSATTRPRSSRRCGPDHPGNAFKDVDHRRARRAGLQAHQLVLLRRARPARAGCRSAASSSSCCAASRPTTAARRPPAWAATSATTSTFVLDATHTFDRTAT